MPYLPINFTMPTVFPKEYGKDILHAIGIIEEKWRRFFPEINYFTLKKAVTPLVNDDVNTPVGEVGTTAFDALWGETVDPQMLAEQWKQPHQDETDTVAAANVALYDDPIRIRAQIRREARDNELKKLGFDRVRQILVTIPLSLLDRAGITVQQGDRFVYDNDLYEVKQQERTGYWKNTNLRIYMVLNCEHARMGS